MKITLTKPMHDTSDYRAGIFLYEQEIYETEASKHSQIRTYKFKLLVKSDKYFEHLEFIATLVLSDYVVEKFVNNSKRRSFGINAPDYYTRLVDLDKIVSEFASETYTKLKSRIDRKEKALKVARRMIDGDEFLTFTEDSAYNWCGAFEAFGQKGCKAMVSAQQVCLYGTDDFSMTRDVSSKEEAVREVEYLRMMQPLDFDRDISERGYIFSN